jgi:hypothetical protein
MSTVLTVLADGVEVDVVANVLGNGTREETSGTFVMLDCGMGTKNRIGVVGSGFHKTLRCVTCFGLTFAFFRKRE